MIGADSAGVMLAVLSSLIAAPGPLLFKKASLDFSLRTFFRPVFFMGGAFYALSALIAAYALKQGELSLIGPFLSLVYVWVAILSRKVYKEKITAGKLAGICLILLGSILIGAGM